MSVSDPVMAVLDKLPLASSQDAAPEPVLPECGETAPFGLRFAVSPATPSGKHEKTYYTVTVKEATQVSRDGKVETVQDDVRRERED